VENLTATHCLDACAVIAYLRHETGAEVLQDIIEQPTSLLAMHVCNLGEVYYDFFSLRWSRSGPEGVVQHPGPAFRASTR
jgi:hypothetical protein